MLKLEQTKYQEPKFAVCLDSLTKFIKGNCASETSSVMTSNFSVFKGLHRDSQTPGLRANVLKND